MAAVDGSGSGLRRPIAGARRGAAGDRGLLARACDGGGALVLAGEPGIGKTDLLAAAREQAGQAGFRVLSAVGSQVEAELPYVGLRRLPADVLDGADLLPGAQRRALLTALGVLTGPAPQPFLVALAASNLLAETATGTPVLVCVDDLQWLDQPSADVVGFVARRLGYDPVVLLATSRTQAGERPVPADLPRLDIGALAEQDARRVVEAVRGDLDDSVREEIVAVSQGNPLALVELSAHWHTGTPGPAAELPPHRESGVCVRRPSARPARKGPGRRPRRRRRIDR
ncbi:AAA family ATPase [Streptomyces sp. NPDC054813]